MELIKNHYKKIQLKLKGAKTQDEINCIILEWVNYVKFQGFQPVTLGIILINDEKIDLTL